MGIELNQATFRRLVQLSLLLLAIGCAMAIYEEFDPKWSAFGADFDMIATEHFGSLDDVSGPVLIALGVFAAGLLLWIVVSLVAALRFRPWARLGLWLPMPIFMLLGFAVPGLYPQYTTALYDLLALLETAIMGAIVLLAYSSDHGARWFARNSTNETEN